jgi:hypothetical protein
VLPVTYAMSLSDRARTEERRPPPTCTPPTTAARSTSPTSGPATRAPDLQAMGAPTGLDGSVPAPWPRRPPATIRLSTAAHSNGRQRRNRPSADAVPQNTAHSPPSRTSWKNVLRQWPSALPRLLVASAQCINGACGTVDRGLQPLGRLDSSGEGHDERPLSELLAHWVVAAAQNIAAASNTSMPSSFMALRWSCPSPWA